MTTTTALDQLDESRIEGFLEQFMIDIAGAATTVMTALGDRLGLYEEMTGAGHVTSRGLADATGLNHRLVTEWLAAQTVSGYIEYDPAEETFRLPAEHATVLSLAESPTYLVSAAEIVAGQFGLLDALEKAFRTDGGVDYSAFPARLFSAVERYFRTAYANDLTTTWLPAVEGLVQRLDDGVRVADLGCGHGAGTILMAQTWPNSTFVGYDFHDPSITVARARAMEAGDPPNLSFQTADAAAFGPGPVDVVVFLDALHDMGDPPAVLRHAYQGLSDGGIVVAVEPWSVDRLEDAVGNLAARIDYSASTSLCTPGSLAQPGAYGLGTLGGPSKRLRLLEEAGFVDADVAADTGFNLVLAAFKHAR